MWARRVGARSMVESQEESRARRRRRASGSVQAVVEGEVRHRVETARATLMSLAGRFGPARHEPCQPPDLAACTQACACMQLVAGCSARSGSQASFRHEPRSPSPPHQLIIMALRTLARSALRFTPPTPAVRPPTLTLTPPPSRTLQLLSRRSFSSSSKTLRAPAPNATGTHAHSPLVPKNGQSINRSAKNNHQFWYREVFPCKCCAWVV